MGGLTLPTSKVFVLFVDPRFDPAAAMALSKVWVLLSEVPGVLRRYDLLLEATKMIGRPQMVDEGMLAGRGPIQMLFHSPNPSGIPKLVLLFANHQGLSVEAAKGKESVAQPSSDQDHAEEEDETDDLSRSKTHWKRHPSKAAPQDNPSAGDKGDPPREYGQHGKQHANMPAAPTSS
jgi:hypothetical protein